MLDPARFERVVRAAAKRASRYPLWKRRIFEAWYAEGWHRKGDALMNTKNIGRNKYGLLREKAKALGGSLVSHAGLWFVRLENGADLGWGETAREAVEHAVRRKPRPSGG